MQVYSSISASHQVLKSLGLGFNPSVLGMDIAEKEKTREAVVKVLRKVADLSNSNLHRNTDALLATMHDTKDILWAGEEIIPKGKFALTY